MTLALGLIRLRRSTALADAHRASLPTAQIVRVGALFAYGHGDPYVRRVVPPAPVNAANTTNDARTTTGAFLAKDLYPSGDDPIEWLDKRVDDLYSKMSTLAAKEPGPPGALLAEYIFWRNDWKAWAKSTAPFVQSEYDRYAEKQRDYERRYAAMLPKAPPLDPLKPGEKDLPPPPDPFTTPPASSSNLGTVGTIVLLAGVAGVAWFLLRGVI